MSGQLYKELGAALLAAQAEGDFEKIERMLEAEMCAIQASTMRAVATSLEQLLEPLANPKVDPVQTIKNVIAHTRKAAGDLEKSGRVAEIVQKARPS